MIKTNKEDLISSINKILTKENIELLNIPFDKEVIIMYNPKSNQLTLNGKFNETIYLVKKHFHHLSEAFDILLDDYILKNIVKRFLDTELLHINLTLEFFKKEQKEQIEWGIKDKLDILNFTNPKYDYKQMREIRGGLQNRLDVSIYTILNKNGYPIYDDSQMHVIRWGLLHKVDVSVYTKLKENEESIYDYKQMRKILTSLVQKKKVGDL